MALYCFCESGLNLVFEVTPALDVRLLHFSALPFDENNLASENKQNLYRLFEFQASGFGRDENHGMRYMQNRPGNRMTYGGHRVTENETGRRLEIDTRDAVSGLCVKSVFQFYNGLSLARCWQEIGNLGGEARGIEYISSFSLTGISKEGMTPDEEKVRMYIPNNGWQAELQWDELTLEQLGFHHLSDAGNSTKRVQKTNVGAWSSAECLPMAMFENRETGCMLFWQIENNSGWHWEICDAAGQLVLNISGPSEIEHHWWKRLRPGETFKSVPVCVGSVVGGVDEAARELTLYRRRIRRPNRDDRRLPVIFNDYMNCLWASPTTEKELPMIEAAAKIGCEYYVVDAGWYTDGDWWIDVGEWMPSKRRFPGGIKEVMDAIRAHGMIPGIWLEIEVMGVNCPKLKDTDDSWFFMRHGSRVMDSGRYQLDFSNPKVREFASETVRRVVEDYGVGYIKVDYNINAGIGTETGSDSLGEGLMRHTRAYLDWLDSLFVKYPDLIIENCSSGGMRMDYSMLSRYSIQSTSDQSDYIKYAVISANAPSALTPEQAAIWSYPLKESSREDIIFNVVNSILMRIHQSGNMNELTDENRELVREGLEYYKSIREQIPEAIPFWPLGLKHQGAPWLSMGLDCANGVKYVAVWRVNSTNDTVVLPIKGMKGKQATAEIRYPKGDKACFARYNPEAGSLSVFMPHNVTARVIEIREQPSFRVHTVVS